MLRRDAEVLIKTAKTRYVIGLCLIFLFAVGSYSMLEGSLARARLADHVLTEAADLRSEIHKTKMAANSHLDADTMTPDQAALASAALDQQAQLLRSRHEALRSAIGRGEMGAEIWTFLNGAPYFLDKGVLDLATAAHSVAGSMRQGEAVTERPAILALHGHHGHSGGGAHGTSDDHKMEHRAPGHAAASLPDHHGATAQHSGSAPRAAGHGRAETVDPHTVIDEFIGFLRKQVAADRDRVSRIHTTLLFFTLLVLVAEILIVFRPLIGTAREEARSAALAANEASELSRIERELRESNVALEAATKAKSLFLATMSHEMRTPMNGVLGMLGLMQRELQSERHRQFCSTAYKSTEALIGVVNDILDATKLDSGNVALEAIDFDIRSVLNDIVGIMDPAAQAKDLKLSLHVPPEVPAALLGDPNRIRQIVMNLVGNAVKFTPSGEVSVSARCLEKMDGKCRIRVEVSDSGIGIPAGGMDRLFKPFTQLDPSVARKFGGSGLGLSICKQLIDLMGGQIGASSSQGAGSTFWFEVALPIGRSVSCEAPAQAACALQVPSISPPLRILLAEDNPVNQMVAEHILEEVGHRVHTVPDGKAAVEAIQQNDFDLVLMDIQMPEMDGVTATRHIRSLRTAASSLPIIAVTANASKSDRANYLDVGMDDVLLKPYRDDDLKDIIAAVYARLKSPVGPVTA